MTSTYDLKKISLLEWIPQFCLLGTFHITWALSFFPKTKQKWPSSWACNHCVVQSHRRFSSAPEMARSPPSQSHLEGSRGRACLWAHHWREKFKYKVQFFTIQEEKHFKYAYPIIYFIHHKHFFFFFWQLIFKQSGNI